MFFFRYGFEECTCIICQVKWVLGRVQLSFSVWTPDSYTKHLNSEISESLLGVWEQNLTSFVEKHKTRKRKISQQENVKLW